MHYLLLNKDTVWLAFHCEQNEYMETAAQEDVWYPRSGLSAIRT